MNLRLISLLIPFSGLGLLTGALLAEDVTTIDGQVFPNTTLRRSGATVMIRVTQPNGAGMMEMGLPVARIAKVAFLQPPELAKARDAAAKGNAAQVLALTEAYVAKQGDFKDLPGSWWLPMARLRLPALAAASKNAECAELAQQISTLKLPDAESMVKGGALFAALASSNFESVIEGVKELPKIARDPGSALAQLALGKALYSKKDYIGSLKAFLAIKVFYPSVDLLQPAALMGAGDCYQALKDDKRAKQSFDDVVADWPDSELVSEAKKKSASPIKS